MNATYVSLSSGDSFYVDAPIVDVRYFFERSLIDGDPAGQIFVLLGSRYVNPRQVAELTVVREIPSIHSPETLKEAAYDATGE